MSSDEHYSDDDVDRSLNDSAVSSLNPPPPPARRGVTRGPPSLRGRGGGVGGASPGNRRTPPPPGTGGRGPPRPVGRPPSAGGRPPSLAGSEGGRSARINRHLSSRDEASSLRSDGSVGVKVGNRGVETENPTNQVTRLPTARRNNDASSVQVGGGKMVQGNYVNEGLDEWLETAQWERNRYDIIICMDNEYAKTSMWPSKKIWLWYEVNYLVQEKNIRRQMVLDRLREVGLTVKKRTSPNEDTFIFLIRAPFKMLMAEAERTRMRKQVRTKVSAFTGRKEVMYREFQCGQYENFQKSEHPQVFFDSRERQDLTLSIIKDPERGNFDIQSLKMNGVVQQFFPVHDEPYRKLLIDMWCKSLRNQPIDLVRGYFGEKVALYFTWIGFYTMWLVVPAVVGVILFAFGLVYGINNKMTPFYSIFVSVWAITFVEFWIRKSNTQSFKWDVLNYDEVEEGLREDFVGDKADHINPLTGKPEVIYPTWKKLSILFGVTVPVCLLLFAVMVSTMLFFAELKDKYSADPKADMVQKLGPAIGNSIFIVVFNKLFGIISTKLTDFENHRTDTDYENNLIVKVIMLKFINYYIPLIYILFFKDDKTLLLLEHQLGAQLIVTQAVNLIRQFVVPKLTGWITAVRNDTSKAEAKTKWWYEQCLMGAHDSTIDDYAELVVQFGYITLFSVAFPLGALCAFINNLFEIRNDAYNLCVSWQRPWAKKASGIGAWLTVLQLVGYFSVLTNCFIIGFIAHHLQEFGLEDIHSKMLVAVIAEHIIFFLQFVLVRIIPSHPTWLVRNLQVQDHRRRVIERNVDIKRALRALEVEELKAENYSSGEDEEEALKEYMDQLAFSAKVPKEAFIRAPDDLDPEYDDQHCAEDTQLLKDYYTQQIRR